MIAFLWAQDARGLIGKAGQLPWHLPDDLAWFKQVTLGQLLLLGRKTYVGLPHRPLPGRDNLVLTRQADFQAPGAVVLPSREAVLAYAAARPQQDLIIAGGAQVFTLFAHDADVWYVTRLAGEFTGDVFMPPLPWADYHRTASRAVVGQTPALNHTFETWQRRLPTE